MNSQLREKAINLRLKEELSYSEIQKRLHVSKSTLSYWLKDYPLTEEKILELRRKGWSKEKQVGKNFGQQCEMLKRVKLRRYMKYKNKD